MTFEKIIISPHNPQVKNAVRLREKKERDSRKLMIIDGYRAINLALNNRIFLKELFYCEKFFKRKGAEKDLINLAEEKGTRIFNLAGKVFEKIAYGDNPEGVLAVAESMEKGLADLPKGKSALYLVLESLEKPGNLGAILRTADATGVEGVIVCDNQTDIYNPNVIRSSLGTFFAVPVVKTSSQDAIRWFKDNSIKIIAAILQAKTGYSQIDYKDTCALVLGSEDKGLSSAWLKESDFKIKIPLLGQADSLNVSVAAAVILYEAIRQRGVDRKR